MIQEETVWAGQKVTAMGLGRFGGQLAAIRYLAERGARVLVTDQGDPNTLQESLARLHDFPEIEFRWGPHHKDDFHQADLILVSPAVKPGHPCLQVAQERQIPILTEMELFLQAYSGQVVAVSGTVGKSTTATMISHLLQRTGRHVVLGGNLGQSLLPEVHQLTSAHIAVLELSSYQLYWLRREQPRFNVSVLTNFEPHHLEWHGCVDDYRACKQSLFSGQTSNDWAVLPEWMSAEGQWPTTGQTRFFSEGGGNNLHQWPGEWPAHWKTNAAAALCVAQALGIDFLQAVEALQDYQGLPHRLEYVGEYGGRVVINDSKATSPWATIAALKTFQQPTWLIIGGACSRDDAQGMLQEILHTPALCGVFGMGPAGREWIETLKFESANIATRERTLLMASGEDLQSACAWCCERSEPGHAIVMSPGCPSFNEFLHYEERGQRFRELMQQFSDCAGFAR